LLRRTTQEEIIDTMTNKGLIAQILKNISKPLVRPVIRARDCLNVTVSSALYQLVDLVRLLSVRNLAN
jgi:hypothetical protein